MKVIETTDYSLVIEIYPDDNGYKKIRSFSEDELVGWRGDDIIFALLARLDTMGLLKDTFLDGVDYVDEASLVHFFFKERESILVLVSVDQNATNIMFLIDELQTKIDKCLAKNGTKKPLVLRKILWKPVETDYISYESKLMRCIEERFFACVSTVYGIITMEPHKDSKRKSDFLKEVYPIIEHIERLVDTRKNVV